jgi:ATP-dependent Clp protease ATP-binding subunit ClpB
MDINNINFTDKVREIFTISQGKVQNNKNLHIDTAHILESIVETSCLGKSLLVKLGLDMNKLKKAIRNKIKLCPTSRTNIDKTELTVNLSNILKNAQNKAYELGDKFVATDLIILAIL